MRPTSRLLPCILVLAAFSTGVQPLLADAPGAAPQATAGSPAPAATQSGKGTIVKIDIDSLTVEVRVTDAHGKNAMTLVLTLTPATKVTRSKASATIADLKPGDTAAYSETPGSDPSAGTALTLDASKPKGKSKKGQPSN